MHKLAYIKGVTAALQSAGLLEKTAHGPAAALPSYRAFQAQSPAALRTAKAAMPQVAPPSLKTKLLAPIYRAAPAMTELARDMQTSPLQGVMMGGHTVLGAGLSVAGRALQHKAPGVAQALDHVGEYVRKIGMLKTAISDDPKMQEENPRHEHDAQLETLLKQLDGAFTPAKPSPDNLTQAKGNARLDSIGIHWGPDTVPGSSDSAYNINTDSMLPGSY